MRVFIDGFDHLKSGHCGSGAFRDLLQFWGLSFTQQPLSEAMVFGLASGLGFSFFSTPELEPPVYLLGRTAHLEHDICGRLGIGLDLKKTLDPHQGWASLRSELVAGRPTMIWADIMHLDYLNVRLHNTMHDVVVVGFDEEEGVAYLADNDREDIQKCSLGSLRTARNSTAFPGPNMNTIWAMTPPARLPEVEETIRGAVVAAIDNMHGSGLGGVASVVESYPTWPETFGDRFEQCMRSLWIFIEKAGTGGGIFRKLHAKFLYESAELLNDPALLNAGEVYSELAATWSQLAAVSREENTEAAHEKGQDLIAKIGYMELAGVEAMRRMSS